ncbi:triacylglycerol lipase [Saccharomycopsis crataegensis]|uniref:Triacylglycerol lipase n=1 Tax=Saccharomycopsis crataegensis TaxID=43959 RepID=A0AAV5QJ99_9ASCO|nr:triacylglycerol lipase [Saccharomycopsis crataegensis]
MPFKDSSENPFVKRLLEIQTSEETYPSKWDKLIRYGKLLVTQRLNGFTNFEKLILKEPKDCSIVSRYSQVERFEITRRSTGLTIDEIYLNVLRIPHPMRRFIEKSKNIDISENCKNLNFENLEEKADYLRNIEDNLSKLPVIVLIHGLGGQTSQFEELLMLLSQSCDCFAVDLPGFGHSRFTDEVGNSMIKHSKEDAKNLKQSMSKMTWEDFQTDRIVEILENVVMNDKKLQNRKLVLIGHSMGTHIVLKLSRSLNSLTTEKKVESIVLLSPPDISNTLGIPKSLFSTSNFLIRIFIYFPFILNLLRVYDRLGGLYSGSVLRMVGSQASIYTKVKQIRWNLDSDSKAWLRYVEGFQRVGKSQFIASMSSFKNDDDKSKVLILCGEEDQATPINKGLRHMKEIADNIKVPVETVAIHNCGHSIVLEKPEFVSGMILKFLMNNIDAKLDPSFVLTLKAIINGDKWGLKNLDKWKSIQNVSDIIINANTNNISPLLAMKTLRNNDPAHSPEILENTRPDIIGIIDISATGTSNSYDPKAFKRIKYHKLATISKIPPDTRLIRSFNDLVTSILKEYYHGNSGNNVISKDGPFIAVHCHYGFNRTGYLLCSYLIEHLEWTVKDALEAFTTARPPGIRHPHFIDSLYLTYED